MRIAMHKHLLQTSARTEALLGQLLLGCALEETRNLGDHLAGAVAKQVAVKLHTRRATSARVCATAQLASRVATSALRRTRSPTGEELTSRSISR